MLDANMGDIWLRQKCNRCSGDVIYLRHWSVLPKYCVRCRLLEINNLKGLFQSWLDKEQHLRKRVKLPDEKRSLMDREGLRTKVREAIHEISHTQKLLAETCASDRELSRLAFRLAKEKRITNKPRRESKQIMPKTMAPFYQGGAPGLGKRSS